MKKGLLTAVLAVVIAVLFFGAQKAQAGHDIGTLSKENPCVYVRFSLEKGENFFGAFYAVSGTAKDVSIVIENLRQQRTEEPVTEKGQEAGLCSPRRHEEQRRVLYINRER